jgi:hypothetical protein
VFVAATGITAVFDLVPVFGHAFAPRKWSPTGGTDFFGEVLFFDAAHRVAVTPV